MSTTRTLATKQLVHERRKAYDDFSHAITTIDSGNRNIHEGFSYHATGRVASLANGASIEALIVTGAFCYPHINSALFTLADSPADIATYKDTTVSANGTEIVSWNRNLNSSNTAGCKIYTGPTITADGEQIHDRFIPDNGGTGINDVGTISPNFGEEWILTPSSNFLIRLTNNSGGAITVTFEMLWYELGYPNKSTVHTEI